MNKTQQQLDEKIQQVLENFSSNGQRAAIKLLIQSEAERIIQSRIGSLRQALNEDRITDTSKMVTDEYLEHWLQIRSNIKEKA